MVEKISNSDSYKKRYMKKYKLTRNTKEFPRKIGIPIFFSFSHTTC